MAFIGTVEVGFALDTTQLDRAGEKLKVFSQKAATGFDSVKTASDPASIALVDIGRLTEDAAFGIRGMANNIAPLILSLGRAGDAAKIANSTLGKELVQGLSGTGGLLVAVALVTTALQVLPNLFSGIGQSARAAAKDIKSAAAAMITFADSAQFEATIPQIEAALAVAKGQLETVRRAAEASSRILTPRTRGAVGGVTLLPEDAARVNQGKAVVKVLEDQLKAFNAQFEAARLLEAAGLRRKITEEKIARAMKNQLDFARSAQQVAIDRQKALKEAFEVIGELNEGTTFMHLRTTPEPNAGDGLENFATEASVVGAAIHDHLINPTNAFVETMSSGIADIITGFKSMNDIVEVVSQSVRGLVADLIQAAIRAAIIKGIGALLNVPTGGFSSLFLGALGGRAGSVPGVAQSIGAQVVIGGEFRLRGTDLVATIDRTTQLGRT